MSTATKAQPTSQELFLVLEGIRQRRQALEQAFENDPMNYGVTSKIAELREAENRLSERVVEAEKREARNIHGSQQKKITAAYVTKCKEIAKIQSRVETLVDELIAQADELRQSEKDVHLLAQQLDEVPVAPPAPLWRRHGGQALPYAHRVRYALQSL
jgi:seryl-tRNA synthetase